MKNKKGCTQVMENGGVLGQGISGIAAVLQPRNTIHFNKRSLDSRPARESGKKGKSHSTVQSSSVSSKSSRMVTLEKPFAPPSRKLVLHFDVRNTILVADSVTEIGVEQALNSYLTGVTWGYEEDGNWYWVNDKPSLTAPQQNCMTYYKHKEKELVRTPTDRGLLRQHTGDFTQEDLGKRFRAYFDKSLEAFEWTDKESGDDESNSILTMKGKNGKMYHYILPAVFQLIQHLHDAERDFAIVVRTYGMDAPNVLNAIKYSLQGNHKYFPNLSNMEVNLEPGHIRRSENGGIEMEIVQDNKKYLLRDEREMYQFLSQQTGINAFVDDFLFWQTNSYCSEYGKPFWVDTHDHGVQHIIFDDNIRLTDDDSIVDLRHCDTRESDFSSVPLQSTAKYEDMCLVQADLLQTTQNINYFVEKVQACEEKYTQFLQQNSPNGFTE